ncbi:hypothetical protein [Kineococcus aurantiacus]|uniref:Uncharacterized protein n=1 Tax=Kineococcus aurantiacus TaxID=37633 RepID=A0A7Y9DQ24_9ACTN|nr:hypothetical protein [Kineococcus aurantiacus]NYD24694.1 hypothetical protein [Kineococcus aurantiacus]
MLDWGGYPLRAGEPDYTEDDQFWDGARVYQLTHGDVRKRQSRVLDEADVMVNNLLDCTPNSSRPGSKHLITESQRRRIIDAGTVRFVEPEGCLQRWESSDGAVLALLVGEIRSPRLH